MPAALGRTVLRFRKGVSEIISVTLLILIAVAVGSAFYLAAKSVIDAQYNNVMNELNRVSNEASLQVDIVDSYYNKSSDTIHIFVYVSNYSAPVLIDHAYVDNYLVPEADLIKGFNKNLPSGITELIIAYKLGTGLHRVMLTGPNNLKLVTYVSVS